MRFVLFFGFWIFFSSIFASPATRSNARPSRTLSSRSLWRNRLARSAVNRKVGGSSPPRDDAFFFGNLGLTKKWFVPHTSSKKDLLEKPHGIKEPIQRRKLIFC